MTTARLLGAAAALTVSAGLHLAASGVVVPEPPVLDGGGEAAPARMGASFADMVAGAPGVVRPETVRPVEAEAALPASADAIPQAVRDAAAPPAPTEAPPRALRQRADAVAPVATPAARTAHRATRTEPAVPASAPTPADAVAAAGPPPDRSAAQAAVPVMATRAEVTDRVEATEESEAAPLVSRRPVLRPDRMPDPTPRVAEPQRPPPAATGNAAADATRGSDGGLPAAEATASAPVPTRTPQARNAAEAANYP
ncbi:hypothetical protein, partial [Roseicyclus sp.]|uniref:hypothetical protein n=1 Tax=Roseicyclus sp. TaxID=1914329 RepID=UPI003FA117E7